MARSTPAPLVDDSFADLPGLTDKLRLDKWLWAARFFKTRSLAGEEIDKGRIEVNVQVAKASRELRAGDLLGIKQPGGPMRTVRVMAVSTIRGPASQAQRMYEETPESISERQRWAEQRRQGVEPSDTLEQGRPTKRDRRQLTDWQRWSASADDPT